MASKLVKKADGTTKRVLVGSKADPDAQKGGSTRSVTLASGEQLSPDLAAVYGKGGTGGSTPPPVIPTATGDTPPGSTIADAYKDFYGPDFSGQGDDVLATLLNNSKRDATQKIDEKKIYSDTLSRFQAEIDATNKIYAEKLAEAVQMGVGDLGSGRAIQARAGLLGSDFGSAQTSKIKGNNASRENLVRAENAAKIAEILGKARGESSAEIAKKREAQQQGIDNYLAYLSSATERRTNKIAAIASAILDQGLTLEDIDPAELKQIAREAGVSEDDIRIAYSSKKKEAEAAQAAADLEAQDKLSFELSEGQDYYRWDPSANDGKGDYVKIASKAKTYAPSSSSGGGGGDNPQLYAGLSSPTATAVRSRVTSYKSEPMITNFSTIQDGYNFVSSLAEDTTNPADDQALIYALAKALDPGSVVREGEYATAQKYSQSWVNAFGSSVNNALLGTGFLSKNARNNIKNTIKSRYEASKKSYDQVRNQYVSGINSLTGRQDGAAFLTDYATPMVTAPAGGVTVQTPDGQTFSFPDEASAAAFRAEAGL